MSFARLLYRPARKALQHCQRRLASVFDVQTDEEFDTKVLAASQPVAVQFFANWCGPCQSLMPRLENKIEGRGGSILLAKVNVDENADIATDYEITSVPAVKFFKDGEIVDQFTGNIDDETIDKYLDHVTNL